MHEADVAATRRLFELCLVDTVVAEDVSFNTVYQCLLPFFTEEVRVSWYLVPSYRIDINQTW